jgi:pimeloyl-ACP methyl ester carboxylesterase
MIEMRNAHRLLISALPGAALYATHRYREAVRQIDASPVRPPVLPGVIRHIETASGRISYRIISRPESRHPPIVLVHGWGRTADTAWWPVMQHSDRTILAIDLPGHGRSLLDRPFTFSVAAEAVVKAIDDAGLHRPLLVGHSMGGPVCLTTILWAGRDAFTGLVAMATSAFWIRPRQSVLVASAPYALGPRSPLTVRNHNTDLRRSPAEESERISWEYAVRPSRAVMLESALELRRFDARRWHRFERPPTTWVITTNDGIIDKNAQRESAARFADHRIELPAEHSVVVEHPVQVRRIIEAVAVRPDRPALVAV